MPGGRAALGHELADCLWSVLILAHKYDIDLAAEFERTMTELEAHITARARNERRAIQGTHVAAVPAALVPGRPRGCGQAGA